MDCEIIDLRSVKPWDRELVCESVRKTGHLVVVDSAWATGGVAAEISATVAEEAFSHLKAPVRRLTLPDAPAPMSRPLEKAYYLNADDVVATVEEALHIDSTAQRRA